MLMMRENKIDNNDFLFVQLMKKQDFQAESLKTVNPTPHEYFQSGF